MALVAYDDSDNDSNITDDETEEKTGSVLLIGKSSENRLFTSLPEPKAPAGDMKLVETEEVQDEFLLKKETPTEKPAKAPKKITIPVLSKSLSDSDDENDEPKEKKAAYSKHSGLFAMLPAPKGSPLTSKSFIPNVLKRKTPNPKSSPTTKCAPAKKPPQENKSDDDGDMEIEQFDVNTWRQVCGRKRKIIQPIVSVVEESHTGGTVTTAPEPSRPYEGLNNEAFKKLVGSSKIVRENIKLIDLNEEPISEDLILRTKAMTDPTVSPKVVIENPVSTMHKKKHHITFLAEQAKANELELQNQWSANRYSRKQTQAKYGF